MPPTQPPSPLRVLASAIAFNESQKILRVVGRVNGSDVTEFMVFDDGSTDGTAEAVRALGFRVERHKSQLGVGASIRDTIRIAQREKFDVVVIMAGNDKDRPHEIPKLVEPIASGRADFVQGSRYLDGGDYGNMPMYRRIATQFVHPLLFSLITLRRITDSTNGFRAFRVSLFDDSRFDLDEPWLDKYELEPYIFFKAITLGYKVVEVPVTKIYPPHEQGYTKMKPITGWWSILRPLVLLGLHLKK
jgi:dolichol-phosphate mannosyltransferase